MTTVLHRYFSVVDPTTRVASSNEGDKVVRLSADGAQVFSWTKVSDRYDFRPDTDIPLLPDGTVAAFSHRQFLGTVEVSIICGDGTIRRFDCKSKQELPSIIVPGASALVYNVPGDVLSVGTVTGAVHAFDLSGSLPTKVLRKQVCSGEINQMVPYPSVDAVTLFTETDECWQVSLTSDLSLKVADCPRSSVFAQSRMSPAFALATKDGVLGVGNWETGDSLELEAGSTITDLYFLSPVDLAVAMKNEVSIVHLDRVRNEPPAYQPPSDGFIFVDRHLMEVPSRLAQPAQADYIEPVFLPYGTERVHALRCNDEGHLVVVFE